MRLRSSHGEVVRGRCRATNQCGYCARLAAVENAELLALDALAGNAPTVWAVLTTRTASTDPARFYESRRQVMRALKRRWPDAEYAALVEFTTGYGPLSGGRRRPHWNLLLKGVPADQAGQVGEVIRRVWCGREDAEPWAQHVGAITEAGGLMRYIALHFQKESQAPPAGWRGHRFTASHGYLATSTPVAREQARSSLRHKREVWRAIKSGLTGHDAELAAHEACARAEATSWELVYLRPAEAATELPEGVEAGVPADVVLYDRGAAWGGSRVPAPAPMPAASRAWPTEPVAALELDAGAGPCRRGGIGVTTIRNRRLARSRAAPPAPALPPPTTAPSLPPVTPDSPLAFASTRGPSPQRP